MKRDRFGVDPLLLGVVNRIFRERSSPEIIRAAEQSGQIPASLWAAVTEGGFAHVGVADQPEGSLADAASVVWSAGRHAVPAPIAETVLIAAPYLDRAGLAVPSGPITVAPPSSSNTLTLRQDATGWILDGTATRVPWARAADRLMTLVSAGGDRFLVSAPLALAHIAFGSNLASEPRDKVMFEQTLIEAQDVAPAPTGLDAEELDRLGALSRSLLIAGALETVLEMTVDHAQTREQFGRPLNRFQAVSQNLAVLAEQSATAAMAAELAVTGLTGDSLNSDTPVAKIVTGSAATEGARLAHQILGAIGVTAAHDLQLWTRRLWSWRDEYGSEHKWATQLGAAVVAHGADAAWAECSSSFGMSLDAPDLDEKQLYA